MGDLAETTAEDFSSPKACLRLHFSTINPLKTIINRFQRIKRNQFFYRFNGPIILKISEGDNLTDNDGFSMI